jgi:hypothetical protein
MLSDLFFSVETGPIPFDNRHDWVGFLVLASDHRHNFGHRFMPPVPVTVHADPQDKKKSSERSARCETPATPLQRDLLFPLNSKHGPCTSSAIYKVHANRKKASPVYGFN